MVAESTPSHAEGSPAAVDTVAPARAVPPEEEQARFRIVVHTAGVHARGHMGYGSVVRRGKAALASERRSRSRGSGPQSEYLAILLGIEAGFRHAREDPFVVQSPSELAVKQLLGALRIRDPDLQSLAEAVRAHPAVERVTIEHRPAELLRDAISLARQAVGVPPRTIAIRPGHPAFFAFRGDGAVETRFEVLDGHAVEYLQWEVLPLESDLLPFPGVGVCRLECSAKRLAQRLAEDAPLDRKRFQILCEEHHGFRLYRLTSLGELPPDDVGSFPISLGGSSDEGNHQSTLEV